jgi:hypothetical protein
MSNAGKPMLSKADNYAGKSSWLSEPEALVSLTRTVIPDIDDPMQTEMILKEQRECRINDNGH